MKRGKIYYKIKIMDLIELYFFPSKLLPERIDSLSVDILDFLRSVNEWLLN